MNKQLSSWHKFYPNKQKTRDNVRNELTFYRKIKKTIYTKFENAGLIDITEISESLNQRIYIKNADILVSILILKDDEKIEVKFNEEDVLKCLDLNIGIDEILKRIKKN